MNYHFFLHFIQRFSFLQQYLIILSIFLLLLLICNYWWCIFLLPLSTIFVSYGIKRLSRTNQSPWKSSAYLCKFLLRKRSIISTEEPIDSYETALKKEYDTYTRIIIARYIGVWYYPLISTDQDFLHELETLFNMIHNRLSDRLRSLNLHELIRLIINLKQKHMEQYLHTIDSCRKHGKQNRINKLIEGEFCQLIGFHNSINKNDIHAYFKALVELLLTDLLPETFDIYSLSRPAREFLTQILVNCVFLPLFNQFSKPQMIYYLLVILLETEEEKKIFEANENSLIAQIEIIDKQNEQQSIILTNNPLNLNNEHHQSNFERIINSASIISIDTAYNSMSGAAYTVYIIQCETKSPYTSDATHRYTIRRRFREFMNLHKRLQQNRVTSQHCYDIDQIYRHLPTGMDNMNLDVIRRRRGMLEKYIQKVISNEVLNCSHDVLEFFAFNSDPNISFESSPSSKLPVPRVDKAILRTLSDVGNKLSSLLPTKREETPLRQTFQLNISPTYEDKSPMEEQLKHFKTQVSFALRRSTKSLTLNSTDKEFLQSLLTRPSIVISHREKKYQSDIPLTDAILNLIHTCLHSRDALISNESIHQILRTCFGHFIEELFKNQIDNIFSAEKFLTYLISLRTKVLWPDNKTSPISMINIKHRAYNAFIHKIPMWLQHMVGVEHIHQLVFNLLECLSYEKLNRHFLFNIFDLLIEKLIPNISTEDFLTKYVYMHADNRS